MTLLIVYVLLALGISFTCSVLEAVLLSVTPSYVSLLDSQRHPAAARLRALKEDLDRPLAAILSLNTVAHTVGAAGAGAQAARVFGSNSVGVFSAVLTLLVLVLSEIVPKTLGAAHWRRLAPLAVRPLQVLIVIMWPLVKLAQWLTHLMQARDEALVSRDEIVALADEGKREGVVREGESRVLRNLMRLAALRVRDVMTPREHVVALPAGLTFPEVAERMPRPPFSRLPIASGEGDAVRYTRYVLLTDVLGRAACDEREQIEAVSRDLLAVNERDPLPAVFDRMAERREHIAVALDDRGRTVGLITMEDIIETLLGVEIYDEADDEQRIHDLARRHWMERARRKGHSAGGGGAPEPSQGEPESLLGITGGEPPQSVPPTRD